MLKSPRNLPTIIKNYYFTYCKKSFLLACLLLLPCLISPVFSVLNEADIREDPQAHQGWAHNTLYDVLITHSIPEAMDHFTALSHETCPISNTDLPVALMNCAECLGRQMTETLKDDLRLPEMISNVFPFHKKDSLHTITFETNREADAEILTLTFDSGTTKSFALLNPSKSTTPQDYITMCKAIELAALLGNMVAVNNLTILQVFDLQDEVTTTYFQRIARYAYAEGGDPATALQNWCASRQKLLKQYISDIPTRQRDNTEAFFGFYHNKAAWWVKVMHNNLVERSMKLTFEEWTQCADALISLGQNLTTLTQQVFPFFSGALRDDQETKTILQQEQNSTSEMMKDLVTNPIDPCNHEYLTQIETLKYRLNRHLNIWNQYKQINSWAHDYVLIPQKAKGEDRDHYVRLLMSMMHELTQTLFTYGARALESFETQFANSDDHKLIIAHKTFLFCEALLDNTAFDINMLSTHKLVPEAARKWQIFIYTILETSLGHGWHYIKNPLLKTDIDDYVLNDSLNLSGRLTQKIAVAKNLQTNLELLISLSTSHIASLNTVDADIEIKELREEMSDSSVNLLKNILEVDQAIMDQQKAMQERLTMLTQRIPVWEAWLTNLQTDSIT